MMLFACFLSGGQQKTGRVIGVDLLHVTPIPGAELLTSSDFTQVETQEKIRDLLGSSKVNVVLSDMAPSSTGVQTLDHELIMQLCVKGLHFSLGTLTNGGHFLCKIFQGANQSTFEQLLSKCFTKVQVVKPKASRVDSAELYLLASNFELKKKS